MSTLSTLIKSGLVKRAVSRGWKPLLLIGLAIFLLLYPFFSMLMVILLSLFSPLSLTDQSAEIEGVPYAEVINQAAAEYGVDPALIAAIIKAESNFNPKAQSHAGAQGLMQVMPFNAKGANLLDPEQNIRRGVEIIASHLKKYDGDLKLALAAYNAGPGAVAKDLAKGGDGIPDYPETQTYVKKVQQYYEAYKPMVQNNQLMAAGDGELMIPTKGKFTSGFGPRWGRMHKGIDLAAPIGTPIYAAADGIVTRVAHQGDRGYGSFIVIDHGGGMATLYAHMYPHQVQVQVGERVEKGQTIGAVGNNGNSTGPHLHFEIHINNKQVDPAKYLALRKE